MRTMCRPDNEAADEVLPKWFRDLFTKYQDDKYWDHTISHEIEQTFLYEDAKVLLYPALMKMILTRKWTENDMGECPAYINAAARLSPYAMVDLSDDDVELMKQEYEEIINASLVLNSQFKAARSKLGAHTPDEEEAFMVILKRFTNLIFALFDERSPFYRQLK